MNDLKKLQSRLTHETQYLWNLRTNTLSFVSIQNLSPTSYFANKIYFAEKGTLFQSCPENSLFLGNSYSRLILTVYLSGNLATDMLELLTELCEEKSRY